MKDDIDPSSTELLGAEYAKQKRRRFVIMGGVVVVLVAAGAAAVAYQAGQTKARLDDAVSTLEACLFGDAGPQTWSPGTRMRAHQLAAMGGERTAEWPRPCAKQALVVKDAAKDAGAGEGDTGVVGTADALAKALDSETSFIDDLSGPIDAFYVEVEKAGVSKGTAADGARAPAPLTPMTLDALAQGTPVSKTYFPVRTLETPVHQGEERAFLVKDGAASPPAFVCALKEAGIECAALPDAVAKASEKLRLLGTNDPGAFPLVYAGDRGSAGIFRGDTGEKLDAMYAYGGWASAAGGVFALGWREGEKKPYLVSRARGAAELSQAEIDVDFRTGNFYYSSQILWDKVVLRGVDKQEVRRLYALDIDPTSGKLGEPVNIGELPEYGLVSGGESEPPHISGCRSNDRLAVRVKGRNNDFMSFFAGGKWSPPMAGQFFIGRLSCTKTGALLSVVTPGGSDAGKSMTTEARCNETGCKQQTFVLDTVLKGRAALAPRSELFDAIPLGDETVVVWAAGARGGIRMRKGPIFALSESKETLLFDDLVSQGKAEALSTVSDLRLLEAPGHAVLLLATKGGVFPLRIDPSGEVTPEKVTWK